MGGSDWRFNAIEIHPAESPKGVRALHAPAQEPMEVEMHAGGVGRGGRLSKSLWHGWAAGCGGMMEGCS